MGVINATQKEITAFDAKYIPEPNSGCWLWDASVNHKGYGHFYYRKAVWQAHRASYEMHVGPIPDGMQVCHKCDVPGCVNPRHLFVGTNQDNMDDRGAKGRHPKGDKHPHAKLSSAVVAEMRALRGTMPQKDIALRFGCARCTVSLILAGKARVSE